MFREYMHVERFGNDEVQGIELGECYVFPKLDGTNASVWVDENYNIRAGSRKREITPDNDNAGFAKFALNDARIIGFLSEYPGFRLYGEWLCLSGDTKIKLVSGGKRGHTMTLREMYEYQETPLIEKLKYVRKDGVNSETERPSWWKRNGLPQTFSLFIDEDKIKPQRMAAIIYSGEKMVYSVKTRNGYEIKSTLDHKFWTNRGWLRLKDIEVGDVVATTELANYRGKRSHGRGSRAIHKIQADLRKNNVCEGCGKEDCLEVHHIDGDWRNNELSNLKVLCSDCHRGSHKNVTAANQSYNYTFDKIISIEPFGVEDCYDISMSAEEDSASFIANGFVVHNCPHTLKTYNKDAWRKFYVFDVFNSYLGSYVPYGEYKEYLEKHDIDYIPAYSTMKNATYDHFLIELNKNDFLVSEGVGEGIVIKNYNYKNKYGRTTWAKLVTSTFKESHKRVMGPDEKRFSDLIEEKIVDEFLKQDIVEKVYAKISNDEQGWNSKYIPRLLGTVYHDFVTEELWQGLKKHKNPTINFKTLNSLIVNKTKESLPHVFS